MSRLLVSLLVFSLLVGCVAQPTPAPVNFQVNNPYVAQPGDETLMRGDAEIVSASVLLAESNPPQISIQLSYRLPTPCYQLRAAVSQPDSQNRITLDVYGLAPKDKPCSLMPLSTPQEANLSLSGLPAGHYTVWVNGVQVGEFDE